MIYKLNLTDEYGNAVKSWDITHAEALGASFALRIGEKVRNRIIIHRALLNMAITK